MMNESNMELDLISRKAAIAVADFSDCVGLSVEDAKKVTDEVVKWLKHLPSAQPEYDDKEKKLLNMLFEIAYKMIEIQNGYMDIDYVSFDRGDLYNLAKKLGVEDY